VDNALGFTMDVYGPVPLRVNDMSLFRDSRINERMEKLGKWCIIGDLAYRHHPRTHSNGIDANFNSKMKNVRISIEWNYGTTASLFTFIGMKRKFKVYETARVAEIYIVDSMETKRRTTSTLCHKYTSWNVIKVVEILCRLELYSMLYKCLCEMTI